MNKKDKYTDGVKAGKDQSNKEWRLKISKIIIMNDNTSDILGEIADLCIMKTKKSKKNKNECGYHNVKVICKYSSIKEGMTYCYYLTPDLCHHFKKLEDKQHLNDVPEPILTPNEEFDPPGTEEGGGRR